jgi:hypothetical protein
MVSESEKNGNRGGRLNGSKGKMSDFGKKS